MHCEKTKSKTMKKLLFSLAISSLIWVSCGNQEPKSQGQQAENQEQVAAVAPKALDIDNFDSLAPNLVDQLIEISGTCMHTCKHGGTKMFLSGNNPDFRVKVMATDESGNFNAEMEGSDYTVIGILDEYKVDNAELDKLEADVRSGEQGEEEMKHKTHEGEGNKEGEHADHQGDDQDQNQGEMQEQLEQINHLRARLKESGKDHLSFYSIQAKSYKEKK
jgi:hypothetical protein